MLLCTACVELAVSILGPSGVKEIIEEQCLEHGMPVVAIGGILTKNVYELRNVRCSVFCDMFAPFHCCTFFECTHVCQVLRCITCVELAVSGLGPSGVKEIIDEG